MPINLSSLSAIEISAKYGDKSISPVDVIKDVIDAYQRLNPRLNAYRVFLAEEAIDAARASEERWQKEEPLSQIDGIPYGVKDMIRTRGVSTLYGSHSVTADQEWEYDAPIVARLREGGAVFLGKTTTSEFGWKGTADSALTGITRNPWNLELTSGGSSGGAAAAAAVGLGPLQLGTDGGGSLRIPASFCGVFGFKATFGRIPAWPPGPMHSLSNVGPISRTVDDTRLMMNFISRMDHRDWHALPEHNIDYLNERLPNLKGKRIGFCFQDCGIQTNEEVASAIRCLAIDLEAQGASIEEIKLDWNLAQEIFEAHWHAGAHYLVQSISPELHGLIDEGLRDAARLGAQLSIEEYQTAIVRRQTLGASIQSLFQNIDAIITPTLPILPFKAGDLSPAGSKCKSWIDWNPFTYPFNLTRHPAASVPIAHSIDGAPIGAQIVGPLYADFEVLDLARVLEKSHPMGRPDVVY